MRKGAAPSVEPSHPWQTAATYPSYPSYPCHPYLSHP